MIKEVMMKCIATILLLTIFLTVSLYAQKDTVYVESDLTGEGNLNDAINAAIDGGTLSNTVFKLEIFGYYIITGAITVPQGEHLEIVAPRPGTTQETAPPQIVWTASGGVTKDFYFECYGDLTMKNIWIRYADVGGVQVGSSIQFHDDEVANASGKGEVGVFEGCIFDYSSAPPTNTGGAINVLCKMFKGYFKNCYFRNCIDTHLRYYGRAVSFPFDTSDWHNHTVDFENCTFANIGYVYMQESNEWGENVHFNHCTFVNVMMFTLESGWWYKMSVTNSIWVNPYMFGYIPAQGTPAGGAFSITLADSIPFTVPFEDQDRRILFSNSSYFTEQWLVDWMFDNPYSQELYRTREWDLIPQVRPMLDDATIAFFDSISTETEEKAYPYMNMADIYDSTDPGFLVTPTNLENLKLYLQYKWDDNSDTNWAWNTNSGWYQEWPLPEDLSYTNEMLKTAGMGGFPLGDLRWWPDKQNEWEEQAEDERKRIMTWVETGKDPNDPASIELLSGEAIPSKYSLSQNFPNPFNPTTTIEYTVPKTGQVSLIVYNTLGQEVATIFEGSQKAGSYLAIFDGRGLASGVYYYRLQSENVAITKKFILMK
jgi:hypothetical protein